VISQDAGASPRRLCLIAQRPEKAPHGNPGGGRLLRDTVGRLERKLVRITQQVTGNAFARRGQVGELLLEQLKKAVLFCRHVSATDRGIVIAVSLSLSMLHI
jgi:hypothetical protein